MRRRRNAFSDFLYSHPAPEIAKRTGAALRTVYYWRRGEQVPRAHHIRRIITLTRGIVDVNSIYEWSNQGGRNV